MLFALFSVGAFAVWADDVYHRVSAGMLTVSQIPGWGTAYLSNTNMDDNTNSVVTLDLSVKDFRLGTYNRADYNVQAGATAAGQHTNGVLMACVAQNGRTNAAADSVPGETTNAYPIATIATNANGSYRICSFICDDAGDAGSAKEYNVNVAAAFFPYTNYWGGFARNSGGTNGGANNRLTASPGLVYGVNYIDLGDGQSKVDLTDKGIDSRTDGILLVSGAKDENNFALSQVNTSDGTWNVFLHDTSTGTSTNHEQDPVSFVFIPKYATNLVSGRVNGDASIEAYSGDSPQFSVDLIGTGTYLLQMLDRGPTNGVLIISPEGGGHYNLDNIVSYEITEEGDGWVIQSRDTPNCGLQTVNNGEGDTEPAFDFVYVPAPLPGITVAPTNNLMTSQSGGTASFTVRLDLVPEAAVTINVNSSDTSQGTIDKSTLTFTTNNWNAPQVVMITGQHDTVPYGSVPYTIELAPAVSADARYNGLDPDDVSAANINDLAPGIAVNSTSFTTTDLGGTATFTVSLTKPPTANVVVPLASSNTNAGTVSPASLTFMPDNYAAPQTVTVTGALDRLSEGNVSYTIGVGPAVSTDSNYNGLANAQVVSGVNLDTDSLADPAVVAPTNNAVQGAIPASLQVEVGPGVGNQTVTFYGRQKPILTGGDFMIAVMPDSQYYSASMNGGKPAMFYAQTDWIASHRAASNIVYAAQLGDIVDYGDTNHGGTANYHSEWFNATNALYRLENPATTGLPDGIPYGACVGNHDESPNGDADGTSTYYNRYFGVSHFAGRSYYGGHYGTTNNDHYDLFSANGVDFIALYFQYDTSMPTAKLNWANNLLHTYSNRHAMVFTHNMGNSSTPVNVSGQGNKLYTALRTNANLFLMHGGHVSGEGRRTNVFRGHTVYILVADYQSRDNGGNGWMRLYHFSSGKDIIQAITYSPWLNQYETDGNSQFKLPLPFDIPTPSSNKFVVLGTSTVAASGGDATVVWPGLARNTQYEWYATVSDSWDRTVESPTWTFTTAGTNTAPTAANASVTVYGDCPTNLMLTAFDADRDALTFYTNQLPTHGLLPSFIPATGEFTYCPTRGFRGSDRLNFSASDGQASSSVASMYLNVVAPPDTNGNGLPDAWETACGVTDPNADDDGDGQSNLQEYYAGTNPTNAASVLRITDWSRQANGYVSLTWPSIGGTRYRVQFRNGATNSGVLGTFTDIVRPLTDEMDPSSYGATSTQSFTDDFTLTGGSPTNHSRYYRVRVSP